ncbi:hypothetical protein R2F61_09255 [Mollicutes bacterium LVI A0078]|nr:hypothetical protein RZE84_09030 [Mollicutes bacterium LVI A0075]WOO90885.1 hypothetical protein R2F61_09255 [Mollicutes bacterium LVI A0078]
MNNTKRALIISVVVSLLLVLLIVLVDPLVSDRVLAPDTGASHYYWKLPTRNNFNQVIVWLLFLIHLSGNYYLIRKRLKVKERDFTIENTNLLVFNVIMILIHFVQSIIGYDGLAQDVSVFSSQYSVIFMLVTIILMEIPRRGIIFGKKIKIDKNIMKFLYAIHGFVFTFSIVYTFWYHPVINTIGHLFGFFYMFLLFTQLSFVKTKIHTNPKWIVSLEVLVAFHGASVAYYVQNSSLWSMFLFGFGFIFVFTQIYGLALKKMQIYAIQLIFIICAVGYYLITDISNVHQILWIPIVEYGHVVVMLIIAFGINKIIKNRKTRRVNENV